MALTAIFSLLAVALIAGVNAGALRPFVNGGRAWLGEYPYVASVRVRGYHHCSGAIVSQRHIVTTASCVNGLSNPTVVTGTIFSYNDGQEHTPIKIESHPGYRSTIAVSPFDIAVITVGFDIVFNTTQNKVALPTAPAPFGFMTTAAGYGFINASPTTKIVLSLNKINLPVIPRNQCQEMFGSMMEINAYQICTYNGPNFCSVDKGSPLVFNNELIGVLSYGTACPITAADVFTSVYHLLPWLNETINAI